MRILSLAFLSSVLLLSACGGIEGRVYGGFIQTDLSGSVALDVNAAGTNLGTLQTNVEDTLQIVDPSNSIYLRGEIAMPVGRIAVSAFQYSESGDGTLTANFGNITANAAVSTDIDLGNLKASWTFDLLDLDVVRISPGIGVDLFDIDVAVSSVTPVVAFEDVNVLAPVPMVFLQGEVDLGYLAVDLEAGAMSINLPDADGTYWDLEGFVRINPVEHVEFFAGYRFISLDGDGEADGQAFEADLELQGWMIGGGVTF